MKRHFLRLMPKRALMALALATSLLEVLISCSSALQDREAIVINLQEKGNPVSPSMYGVFFEEINHAGDGGLYAELVKNRSFEEKEMPDGYTVKNGKLIPKQVKNHLDGCVHERSFRWSKEKVPGWALSDSTMAKMDVTKEKPAFETAPSNLRLDISDSHKPLLLINEGYWGMNLKSDDRYLLRTIIRTNHDYKGKISVQLLSSNNELLAEETIETYNDGLWHDVSKIVKPTGSDSQGKLALCFDSPGTIWIDYVSLFPENTYNNRSNGLRKDVAEFIAALKPAFFRWPGGCVVEGITLGNHFEWKKTLGDPASRPGEYSTWGYRCSYGLGYHEILQFCEDIGAQAMYVCNVGIGCQFRMGDASPNEEIEDYIADCMDAIEYAIGDPKSKWGAIRAAAGHIKPFPLGYIEIGNENWGPEYDRRFDMFYSAIKEKYPKLKLIYNDMPQRNGASQIPKTDLIDPHWYVDPYFFMRNSDMYDGYKRGNHDIYVGEYAVNRGVGSGNIFGALAEAAFIGGMERNGDLVKMASYAPLFENRNDRVWQTNLIWIDTDQVLGRSSYYVQKMASENRPTYNLACNISHGYADTKYFEKGYIGFGSDKSDMEFSDIAIEKDDETIFPTLTPVKKNGEWSVDKENQSVSTSNGQLYLIAEKPEGDYTIKCRAKKSGGQGSFQIFISMNGEGTEGYKYNLGMWSSRDRSELVCIEDNEHRGILAEHQGKVIEPDKWYDIKIHVNHDKSELFINDEKILSYQSKPMPLQFINAGYDDASKEVIIKVVNACGENYAALIKLDNAIDVIPTGKIITLHADNPKMENNFESPRQIYPHEVVYDDFANKFDYDFPPYSYTIMRIAAQRRENTNLANNKRPII